MFAIYYRFYSLTSDLFHSSALVFDKFTFKYVQVQYFTA